MFGMKTLTELEKRFGITFAEKDLLEQAFVHRSYLNEHPKFHLNHNERLEYLGDAVLELVVTEHLYGNYENPEGDLTSWRAALVNSRTLADLAEELDFNTCLLLSRGEAKDMGRARQYILANTFEAFVGALYLDQGYEACKKFIGAHLIKRLPEILEKKLYRDPKSRFQEEAQDRVGVTPTYEVVKEWGPDHAKTFRVGVYLEKELVAEGEGPSKQLAQEDAAQNGIEKKKW